MDQEELKKRAEFQQQVETLEQTVKQFMTRQALERFTNIKLAYPQKALSLTAFLAQMINAGKIKSIDDETLKELLKRMQKRDIKITRR